MYHSALMPRIATVRDAKAFLRQHDMVLNLRDGEYRVTFKIDHFVNQGHTHAMALAKAESAAYYASTLDDAVNTARHMAGCPEGWAMI